MPQWSDYFTFVSWLRSLKKMCGKFTIRHQFDNKPYGAFWCIFVHGCCYAVCLFYRRSINLAVDHDKLSFRKHELRFFDKYPQKNYLPIGWVVEGVYRCFIWLWFLHRIYQKKWSVRQRFELWDHFWSHVLQTCALDHSAISPEPLL